MKTITLNLIERVIILNLGLAVISAVAVGLLWGKFFGIGILAGALAWGLPNWYFSKSFTANKFLGKLDRLKINLYTKVALRFLFILSIIITSLLIFNVNFVVMIAAFLIANLLSVLLFGLLNHRFASGFANNSKHY